MIESAVLGARSALSDCYRQMGELTDYLEFQQSHPDYGGDDEPVYEHLGRLIEKATNAVAVAAEMMDLSLFAQNVMEGAQEREASRVEWYDFPTGPSHDLIDYLESQLRIMERIQEPKTQKVPARDVLVSILQSLMTYCAKANMELQREKDVHLVINQILPMSFPDTLYEGALSKPIKAYSPDFSIRSLETAIEVKFLKSSKEVGPCVDAILADFEGYKDSEYRNFLCYIVQTDNFLSMPQVNAAFSDKGFGWREKDFLLATHVSQ